MSRNGDRSTAARGESDGPLGRERTDGRSTADVIRQDGRDASVLVRTELRTRARHLRGDTRRLLATVFMVFVFGVVFPLIASVSATEYGSRLAGGDVPVGPSGAMVAGVGVIGAYVGGSSVLRLGESGRIGPLVRTSIPPTAVSLGRLTSELLQMAVVVVPAGVVLLLGVAVGAGGPVAPALVAIAALPVLIASLLAGRLTGDAFRALNRRLDVSLWTKVLLFVGGSVVVFVATQALIASEIDGPDGPGSVSIPALLPGTPLQAYASVAFAPLGAAVRPIGVVVAVLLWLAMPVGLVAAVRIEARLLVSESSTESGTDVVSRGVPRPFNYAPAGRIAWRYLLRTRRDPRMLAHLAPLLFGLLGGLANVYVDPQFALLFGPAGLVISGVTLAGAAYCLNPLGDDREQLPLLLTSAPSVEVLLRGRALAGITLGLLVAVGIGTPLALVEYSVPFVLGQTLLAVVLAATGAGTALGMGALAPKFERREYVNVERAHPSMLALMGFLIGGMIAGVAGLVLVWWTVGGAPLVRGVLAWAVYLTFVLVPGGWGYVYSVRKFDAFTLDDV